MRHNIELCRRWTVSVAVLAVVLLAGTARAQWETDTRLTYGAVAATSYNNSRAVAASHDTVHVTWRDQRDGNYEIYYKRSVDCGLSWGEDVRLTTNTALSWDPCIACAGSDVHVVWSDSRDGNLEVYYKHSSDAGASWGEDCRITFDAAWSWYPSLSISDGCLHVVALQGGDSVYYVRSTDGGGAWSSPVGLTGSVLNTIGPSVAASGLSVHVTWVNNRDGNDEIYDKRSTDGGLTWGEDTRLSFDAHSSLYPDVAIEGQRVYVVWDDDRDGGGTEVYFIMSADGGASWGPETRLTTGDDLSSLPSICASGDNVHVVWQDGRSGNLEIRYVRSIDSGVTWDSEIQLTASDSSSYNASVTAADSAVHVAWTDERNSTMNPEVYYKRDPTANPSAITASDDHGPGNAARGAVVRPNPFTVSARVVGHEFDWYELYDASGRMVGPCRGDRVGRDLPAGAYVLREAGHRTSFVIVKTR
jgi:hypothetical protein